MNLKRTSLYQEHVALKAKIVPFAGWDMPVQYTSVKDEVLAVRQKVGVFDVSHMGEFFVIGKDAIKFVDHLVTNDIQNAPLKKAVYSPLCRENGTVIDDLIVYLLDPEKVLICVNASNIEKDFEWMKSQLKGFNCELSNHSEDYSLLAIQGPQSFETLKSFFPGLEDIEYYSVTTIDKFIFARTGYTGEDGFEVFGSHHEINVLWTNLIKKGVTPCGLAARDVLRLEVTYPLYGHELNDDITPLDAQLNWTVKLKKPSFIGRDYLSANKPKFKTIKLSLEKGIPREGYNIVNDKNEVIGVVTSGTQSVMLNKGICLARIEIDKLPQNEVFFVDIRQKLYIANLEKKPFYNGGHK